MIIKDFEDFCLYVYVIVDDLWQAIAPLCQRPGPAPTTCSDSELLTMVLVGECRGWDVETEMLSYWRERPDLFPNVPSQSRFNRRRRHLMPIFNRIRQLLLGGLDLALDQQCVIDSLPVPVVPFHLVPGSTGDWAAYGADFGKISSKKVTIFGYKLHLLVTINGLILDFILAPASVRDLTIAQELLEPYRDLEVLGDKAFISAPIAAALIQQQNIRLRTIPRTNQKQQLSPRLRRLHNQVRQIVETVNGQLAEQFHIEINHAHTFWGLCTRLLSKLTAHTLSIYINRLLGKAEFLQIKALAFPN